MVSSVRMPLSYGPGRNARRAAVPCATQRAPRAASTISGPRRAAGPGIIALRLCSSPPPFTPSLDGFRLLDPRPDAHEARLLEQRAWIHAYGGAGRARMHATHVREAVAEVALDGVTRRHGVRGIVPALGFGRPDARGLQQAEALQPAALALLVLGNGVGTEELTVGNRRLLAGLSGVELARLDHRDVVVRAGDGAGPAAHAQIVLDEDLALGAPLDRGRRTGEHAQRVVAMPAGARHQILAELHPAADEAALAVQRLARLHAEVALDAQLEVHHEQRIGLDVALAPFPEVLGELGRHVLGRFLSPGGDLPDPSLDLGMLAAQLGEIRAGDLDDLRLARRDDARPERLPLEQRHLAEELAGAQVRQHALRTAVGPRDLRKPVTHDVERVAHRSLLRDREPGLVEEQDLRAIHQLGDEGRRHPLEQVELRRHHAPRLLLVAGRQQRACRRVVLDVPDLMARHMEDRGLADGDQRGGARQGALRLDQAEEIPRPIARDDQRRAVVLWRAGVDRPAEQEAERELVLPRLADRLAGAEVLDVQPVLAGVPGEEGSPVLLAERPEERRPRQHGPQRLGRGPALGERRNGRHVRDRGLGHPAELARDLDAQPRGAEADLVAVPQDGRGHADRGIADEDRIEARLVVDDEAGRRARDDGVPPGHGTVTKHHLTRGVPADEDRLAPGGHRSRVLRGLHDHEADLRPLLLRALARLDLELYPQRGSADTQLVARAEDRARDPAVEAAEEGAVGAAQILGHPVSAHATDHEVPPRDGLGVGARVAGCRAPYRDLAGAEGAATETLDPQSQHP